ncbi:uncharacterized protein L201_006696 [Kwoniella dendrophila CBS 6074]|uniref:NUDE domain-containing protein n=1 Tax=Kwoniella dendrophila CBS 6074 TaxID=1295534 RepID=A0AAX4K3R7_9TREE
MSAGLPTLDLPPSSNGFGNASIHKMPSSSTMGWEDEEEDITFDSPQEEISHYREKYRQAMDMLTETRAELEEFQQSSRELEDEMEQELASNEKVQDELKDKIKRLEFEKEDWKSKQIALQKMHSSTTAAMQREMDNLRSERDKTLVALRDLEMGNDELERNERVAVSSLLDLESKYNRAIEEKTLLEQEIIQKQELEEECQRLKDDMRDANNEISILRDQLSRMTLPTPPSSISEPISTSPTPDSRPDLPSEIEENEIDPASIPLPPPVPYKYSTSTSIPQSPSRRLPRSATSSSIPMASPISKRYNNNGVGGGIPQSPTMSSLSRSTTSRNLAAAAKTPQSPAGNLNRSRLKSGLPPPNQASPGTVRIQATQQTKSRGFKLLHDLQARLKATDDKLGVAKVPRRNVSNPLSSLTSNKLRSTSAASSSTSNKDKDKEKEKDNKPKLINPRINALSQSQSQRDNTNGGSGTPMTSSSSSVLSPNGWVLIDGEDEDDFGNITPTASSNMINRPNGNGNGNGYKEREEPISPLDQTTFNINPLNTSRAVSSASNSSQKSLPSRPGIPSPLANINGTNGLNKSTSSKITRKPSSSANRTHHVPFPTTNRPSVIHNATTSISANGIRRNNNPLSPTTSTNNRSKPMSPTTSTSSSRPMSPSMIPTSTSSSSRPMSPSIMNTLKSNSRPMSPSMLPQPSTRQPLRAPSPSVLSRPSSRNDKRTMTSSGIGKGPPPSFHNNRHNLVLSTSVNQNSGQQQLRKSTRRSSLGASEFNLQPTGIPAPNRGGTRTPNEKSVRPITIHGDTPPPVPRIPSGLRKK